MKKYICLVLILIIVFVCFLPILSSDYTNWDDNKFITENKQTQSLRLNNLKHDIFLDLIFFFHECSLPLMHFPWVALDSHD